MITRLKEYSGFLSKEGRIINRTEAHAFVIGVYHGLTPTRGIPDPVMQENQDVRHEPHYAKGGYILGRAILPGIALVTGGQIL